MGATGLAHVEPDGEPYAEAVSPTVTLYKQSVGTMDNNAYLLVASSGSLLIDAAARPQILRRLVEGRHVDAIVTTHRHHDHIGALADLAVATGARLYAGAPDASAIRNDATTGELTGVWDGDVIGFGDTQVEVVGLVGHTPGSVALLYRGDETHLFTGDSLFPGGPGRTRSPRDFASLMGDLETKIFGAFPDETRVHPGHGDDTTLGAERPHLAEWRARGW
ncbi:MBL fold metallo-hydrolase [Propionicicella superfundia]|uniref:MBL fold metallo-hydrolase n=1 Tax=Propionicicella superfundia TaxID=348582 RepID=UPI00041E3969|nr:MBL fold metallo-hydrolase [Propionicicella superfundia]